MDWIPRICVHTHPRNAASTHTTIIAKLAQLLLLPKSPHATIIAQPGLAARQIIQLLLHVSTYVLLGYY